MTPVVRELKTKLKRITNWSEYVSDLSGDTLAYFVNQHKSSLVDDIKELIAGDLVMIEVDCLYFERKTTLIPDAELDSLVDGVLTNPHFNAAVEYEVARMYEKR
jgi:hypothetical protein